MDNYTFFTTPEGKMYGVSKRIMDSGYTPNDGTYPSSPEEVTLFIERAKTTLRETGLTTIPEMVKTFTESPESVSTDSKLQLVQDRVKLELQKAGDQIMAAIEKAAKKEETKDLSPIQKRKLERAQRKQAEIEAEYQAKLREEAEKNKIFDSLTDEQLKLVEVLEDQGLSVTQIRNILTTREEKIKERDEMIQYLAQPKD